MDGKNTSVATLQLLGGHPSLDFANTVSARRDRWGPDVLVRYEDVLAWGEKTGLLDRRSAERLREAAAARPRASAAALARAKRLREAIYGVFSELAAGREPSPADLERIRGDYLAAQSSRRLAARPDSVGWTWAEDAGLDAVTHRVAIAAVELLVRPEVRRVKECLGRNCGWLFYDASRNGSRRWCSDAECGTVHRVNRHRVRSRAKLLGEEP
jgi:predicted RNA-binding Zn ribbon-like protein